jgi:hypothetical protein
MIKWEKPCYKCLSHYCDLSCKESQPKQKQCMTCKGKLCIGEGSKDDPIRSCPSCDSKAQPKREWVELTDEEIADEFYKFESAGAWYQFTRAIEAKLKEKNT